MPTPLRFPAVVALALLLGACLDDATVGVPVDPFGDGGLGPGDPGPGDPNALFNLGRMLFFDRELSGNQNIACATCHVPFLTAAETLPLSLGQGAEGLGPARRRAGAAILPRHTADVFHDGEGEIETLFWDGRVFRDRETGAVRGPIATPPGIESPLALASIVPLVDRAEMLGFPGDVDASGEPNVAATFEAPEDIFTVLVEKLLRHDGYRVRFEAAFGPVEPTIGHVGEALAAFQRRIWGPFDSAFDAGELNPAALEGQLLFHGDAGCDRCHNGNLFSDGSFHNLALPVFGPGFDGSPDEGRFRVTGNPQDRFAFRTQPLRNVALTPPYFHNGAVADLRDAIRYHLDPEVSLRSYPAAPRGLEDTLRPDLVDDVLATFDPEAVRPFRPLSDADVARLVAFLETLSSDVELTKGPDLGVPDSVPSGLPVDRWPAGLPHPVLE